MSDKDKLNLEYMFMGMIIGIPLGYIIAMYIVYL